MPGAIAIGAEEPSFAASHNRIEQAIETDLGTAIRRTLWRGGIGIAIYNLLFLSWLVFKPASHSLYSTVDNIAQALGPLLTLVWFIVTAYRDSRVLPPGPARQPRAWRAQRWAPRFLAMIPLSYGVGQIIWTYYEQVLHESPHPCLADLFFLCIYPCTLLGILLMPTRSIPLATRTRIIIDSLVTMTATVTFSWYFLLGPIFTAAHTPLEAKINAAVYPLQDLVLIFCLLLLWGRAREPRLKPIVDTLSLSMGIVVFTDTIYGYRMLHGTYVTGSLLDVLWPIGLMLAGLAARVAQVIVRDAHQKTASAHREDDAPEQPTATWRLFLPYALVPAVGLLFIYTHSVKGDEKLEPGIYIGAGILVGLTLLRQVLAIMENSKLYQSLQEAYHELAEKNQQAIQHARAMETMNAELQAMQNELVQSAKLASLGTLAAGVAHELNQPVAIIRALAQQLKVKENIPDDLRDDLGIVEGQTGRMSKIIQHLGTFSRMGGHGFIEIEINQVIRDCFILVGAQLKNHNISVELDLCPEDPLVRGDANELEQVFLNLITNARDAIDGRESAQIAIRSAVQNEQVVLEFRDNGPGVPDEIAQRIFDPFFTTKEPGKGTGLGLSISHSIIRKHHGSIHVENDRGALFKIALPLAKAGEMDEQRDDSLAPDMSIDEAA